MKKPGMEYMKGYSNGYKPPEGSAGAAAKGEYSHRSNPLSVPRKGSDIYADAGAEYGHNNADRGKVMRMEKEQERAESLRGYGC